MFGSILAAGFGTLGYLMIAILVVVIFLVSRIRIVPQAKVYIVERLGAFHGEWSTGPHFLVPFLDKVARIVSIKEQVVDFKPQPVITKDNVTMQIDTVVFFQITDAKQYTYGIEHPMAAIENLTATTLRNIIGELELDATLTSRDVINTKITALLDQATDPWGIKVNRVELKNILPPREIQDAMEKQMKAERERREKILQAEGEKKSQILVAEGEKESKILKAEAEKQSEILKAEAEKQALILRADAVREQKVLEATGEAQAIEMVQKALADSIVKLNQAAPNDQVIKLKSLEAFAKAADGKATKLIIPSEIQGLAGMAGSLKEIIKEQ
ncbi:SPFH domain-containing protein [Ruminococcus champanellensis]